MKYFLLFLLFSLSHVLFAQYDYNDAIKNNKVPQYKVEEISLPVFKPGEKPANIILLIGDGMSVAHIQAAMTVNRGNLYINYFKDMGLVKTHSSDNYITDSAAGGTALATGRKTNKRMISVSPDSTHLKTILEISEEMGKSTGLVATSSITHATPASFIAHQPSRYMAEEIALDFLSTDIDVFIGGGLENFNARKDKRDLTKEFEEKGYRLGYNIDEISKIKHGKLAGLAFKEHAPTFDERGNYLQTATKTAINILGNNKDGFFLMVEGSQIDWGGHANNTEYIVGEMLDFDLTVGEALKFAAENKHTLIIVTSDHETGGMTLLNGDYSKGTVEGAYTTKNHSGVMVPVFAWGPGSELFRGIMDNTDIFKKMHELIK